MQVPHINTSVYEWGDGKTISCYAWINHDDIRWYKINIQEAQRLYPGLSNIQAVKQIAKKRFKKNDPRMFA